MAGRQPRITTAGDPKPSAGMSQSGSGDTWRPIFEKVPPQPTLVAQVPFERAAMLAAAPRKRWGEHTDAAVSGLLAALPSAIDACVSGLQRKAASFEPFEVVQIIIFVGFGVWCLVCAFGGGTGKTADQILRELYKLPEPPSPKRWWHRKTETTT